MKLFLSFFFIIIHLCFSLTGRVKPPVEVIVLQGKDKANRTLSFIQFDCLDSDETYDIFEDRVPKAIARQLKQYKQINVPKDDTIPIFENYNHYETIDIPIKKNPQEHLKLLSNAFKKNKELDQVVYSIANKKKEMLTYYIKKKKYDYIDAHINDDLTQFTNQALYSIKTNHLGLKYFFLESTSKKQLLIEDKLYQLKEVAIEKFIKEINSDYCIYGNYKGDSIGGLELNIFLIYKHSKKIHLVAKKKIKSSLFYESIKEITLEILSFIQKKPLVNANLSITSTPPGAYLYLNEVFIGKTPLRLTSMIEGNYKYKIWHPNADSPKIEAESVNINPKESKLIITKNNQKKSKLNFVFKLKKNQGNLSMTTRNTKKSDFYLNTHLVKKNTNTFSTNLKSGHYFIKVKEEAYLPRWFKIDIHENQLLSIDFNLETKKKDLWQDFFLNHSRNNKVFATLSMISFGALIFSFSQSLELQDQLQPSIKNNYQSSTQYFNTLEDQLNFYQQLSSSLIITSLTSFTIAILSKIFKIQKDNTKIETIEKHQKDVNIKIIPQTINSSP